MAPLRILTLLIDKPGHRHQAEGVAAVMGRLRPAQVERLDVRPRWFVPPPLRQLGVASLRALPAAVFLKHLYGIDVARLTPPEVIVGSGRPAIGVGLLLKRHFGVPFVYSGLGRKIATTAEIDLMLVSVPSFADRANAALVPVPCLIAPDRLPAPRRLATPADLAGATIALLLGGDAHSHRFAADDWDDLARLAADLSARFGARVLVAGSRRTAPAAADRFADLARRGTIAGFVDWRRGGSGGLGAFFAADAILVTEDSVSMMAEAVAAQRPVVALRPRGFTPTLNDEIVATLVEGGAMALLPIAGTSAATLAEWLVGLRPVVTDHRDVLAAALAARLPGLFGPGAAA